ncbi:MAG: tryptophan--tRNA ligase, partial [Roseateles sp.]
AADGGLLLQSQGFAQGRDAGQWVARLKKEGVAALAQAPVQRAEGVAEAQLHEALQALQAAESQD